MKLVWIFFGTLALVLAAFVAANRWDSNLDPEAARILEAQPVVVASGDNLYAALSGFDGAAIRGNAGDLCTFGNDADGQGCLTRVLDPDLKKIVTAGAELEQRYLGLRAYRGYQNPNHDNLNAASPPWGGVLLGHQLHLTRLAMDAVESTHKKTAEDLAADHAFWRTLIGSPNAGLIEKIVANVALRGSLALLGELLRAQKLPALAEDATASMLAPWTPSERSLRSAIEMEFRLVANGLGTPGDGERPQQHVSDPELEKWWGFGSFFYLRNATVNALYRQKAPVLAAADRPCHELPALLKRLPWAQRMHWTGYLRNAIGNVLASVGQTKYSRYLLRQCDLEGLRRVVALQSRVAGKPPERIQAALAAAGSDSHDPYTGAAMVWDASAQTITFKATDQRFKALLPWRLVP